MGGGGGGTSFEMMHLIFSGDHCMQTIFLLVVIVNKQFFSWKIFGTSPCHIVVVEGMGAVDCGSLP